MWLIENLTGIGVALLAIIAVVAGAFGFGKSKGKATAEMAAKVEKVEAESQAIKDIASKQAEIAEVAKNVQSENSNLTDDAARERMRQSKYNSPD